MEEAKMIDESVCPADSISVAESRLKVLKIAAPCNLERHLSLEGRIGQSNANGPGSSTEGEAGIRTTGVIPHSCSGGVGN